MITDALIDAAIAGAELEFRPRQWTLARNDQRTLAVVGASGNRDKQTKRPPRGPRWTQEEDDLLAGNWGIMSEAQIGARIGRSVFAVRQRWRNHHGLPAPTKIRDWITRGQCADLLGVDRHRMNRILEASTLRCEPAPCERDIARIKYSDLVRWAVKPTSWVYLTLENIVDEKIKRMIELRQDRWGDAWKRPSEAAEYLGVSSARIGDMVRNGTLPAIRWGCNWLRQSDLDEYARRRADPGVITEDMAEFLILARAVGLFVSEIGALADIKPENIVYRLRVLRPMIGGLVIKNPALWGVKYDPDTDNVIANWKDHERRFPRLALACRRYAAGMERGRDVALVRQVVVSWYRWYLAAEHERQVNAATSTDCTRAEIDGLRAQLRAAGADPLEDERGIRGTL